MTINEFLLKFDRSDYQKENFSLFLNDIKFEYKVPSVHIAGTNGKGSTANYLSAVYKANGYKVGLYTSPWLFKENEMISINGNNISDEDFISIANEKIKEIEKHNLSIFEIQTYVALTYFKNSGVDIAIIECGMGGEFDATNIFTPVLSVITSISLEHTAYLGRTISEIALNKAGIIKDEIPVLVGELEDEALETIVDNAKEKQAPLSSIAKVNNVVYENGGITFSYLTYKNVHINSLADYSVYDCSLSLEAASILKGKFSIDIEKAIEGIGNVYMPCRMNLISENPKILIDGAHNPEGISRLVESLKNVANDAQIHVIFSCFKDKNIERMLAYLGEYSKDVVLTSFPNPRSRTLEDYFLFSFDHEYIESATEAIQNAIDQYPNDFIVITGSLAFAAYAYNLFAQGDIHNVTLVKKQ